MLENMAADPTYVKEKDSYEIELKGLAKEMKDAQKKCVFNRGFCLKEVADMKSAYETSVLHEKLDAFLEDLKKPTQAVERKLKEILAVSRTRLLVADGTALKPAVAKKGKKGHVATRTRATERRQINESKMIFCSCVPCRNCVCLLFTQKAPTCYSKCGWRCSRSDM